MKVKLSKPVRTIRFTVRQTRIRLQDRLGAWLEALGVFVVGVIFLFVAYHFGIGNPNDWAAIIGAFVVAAVVVFLLRKAARQQTILIEVTMSYLLHGGRPLLDSLLGKLIAGRWRREQLKPGDALFDVLKQISVGQDWEMRRRVTEALPALGHVDARRTLEIARILRDDWEPSKWESDLRRRVVEALVIPVGPGDSPLIDMVRPQELIPLLRLREKDQVYVAMAIAEALHEWEDTQPKVVAELRDDLLEFVAMTFPQDQSQSISDLLKLLQVSRSKGVSAVLEEFEEMSKSSNTFTRIASSRNVLLLSERFPRKTLDFVMNFLEPTQPNNVRRPMARERSMEFLIKMIGTQAHRAEAEEVLWKLFSDTDEIIRIAAFDKAEEFKEKDNQLLLKVCNYILENDTSQILRERTERVKADLSGDK